MHKHVVSNCKRCLKPEDKICRVYNADVRLCSTYNMTSRTPKSRIVCFVYSRNLKFYGKGLQQRSYSSKVKCIKVYIKITSIETMLVTLLPNLKMFLPVETNLEATTQRNFSKSRKFSLIVKDHP